MTREQLETRIRSSVSRYARTIADSGGVPRGLVEELAAIAEHHATEAVGEAVAFDADTVRAMVRARGEGVPVVASETVKPAGEPLNPPASTVPKRTRRTTDQTTDRIPIA